jgi:hypothetical protein
MGLSEHRPPQLEVETAGIQPGFGPLLSVTAKTLSQPASLLFQVVKYYYNESLK